jgi:hypothetical protein
MPDGTNWRLNAGFRYSSDVLADTVDVPARFVTDFASIPKALQNVLPPWSRYGAAAVVHDALYFFQTTTREQADEVLREAMQLLAVDDDTIARIYGAVRAFGQGSWERNTELRKAGFTRMASNESTPPYAAI